MIMNTTITITIIVIIIIIVIVITTLIATITSFTGAYLELWRYKVFESTNVNSTNLSLETDRIAGFRNKKAN